MTPTQSRQGGMALPRLGAAELLLMAVVGAWSALVLIHLTLELHGGTLTGADSPFAADQLQYLAWVRDSGAHILAGNLFEVPPGARVFLHPMWLISGLLWRAGVPIAVTLLIWKPVAVVALVLGVRAYVAKLVPCGPWTRTAIVLLAVGYASPLILLTARGGLLLGEIFTSGQLWGYTPAVLAVALMPVYLLALERAACGPPERRRRALMVTAGSGLLAGWLHPWQGETLAVITVGLLLWRRGAGARPLVAALASVLLPLAGYFILSRLDHSWRLAEAGGVSSRSVRDLALVLAPIAAVALAGLRRPRGELQEQALLLWPLASLLGYFAPAPSYANHALEGLAIPLAVMAARGVGRAIQAARTPSRGRELLTPLATATIALALTVPGSIHVARAVLRLVGNGHQGQIVDPAERSALRYLAMRPGDGGVLAPAQIGALVPGYTGKPTWVGHPLWTPDSYDRARFTDALAAGSVSPATAQRRVRDSGVKYVLLGCGSPSIVRILGPLLAGTHRFGCATLYTLR